MATTAVALVLLMVLGIVTVLVLFIVIAVVVAPLWVWRFLRGDRLRLTAGQLLTTGGKNGGSIPYEDIEEIRVHNARVELRLRRQTSLWRRFNFQPGLRKFAFEDQADIEMFLSEMEIRLSPANRYSLPEGGVSIARTL